MKKHEGMKATFQADQDVWEAHAQNNQTTPL